MTRKRHSPVLDNGDVKELLRGEIESAGGQTAFSKKFGVPRVTLNKILHGKRGLTKRIVKLLKLRIVYIRE
jgi:plasmid maintenance system antidote protein VapI